MSLKDRLAKLERQRPAAGLQVISIRGGFSDADLDRATAPGRDLIYLRQPGEAEAEFRDRAIAEARAAGARSIVFGGFDD